jgi:hypothetical protein
MDMSAVLQDALEQDLVEKAHEKKGAVCRGGAFVFLGVGSA